MGVCVCGEYCLQLRRLNRAFLYLVDLTSLTPSPVFFPNIVHPVMVNSADLSCPRNCGRRNHAVA